ncbi:UDP-xylose and UDP-N-acetylglucosamine transporter-like [Tubulanus polymorphus]|uniref:UDP-xylose and UDP-N-acetylglucosamine transporter-like n=1 Tax=Tubulanus polymorphus TaxID=672921 RepID=UPI003DA3A858
MPTKLSSKAIVGMAMVFMGCCTNVVFLEFLVKKFPGSGNIVTFFQFLFIAVEGFIFSVDFGRKQRAIPLKEYLKMVSLFWVVQVVNNYALNFNISMPLHMIFRAGSLMANLILGVILLKKSYPLMKYLSVLMISIGISICTIVSSKNVHHDEDSSEDGNFNEYMRWLIGIGMLLFALFMSARMGIFQECIYKAHGKHPNEALFYNHALPLPIFIFLAPDIKHHIELYNTSEPVDILGFVIPIMWLYLIGNVITQYICIKGVFILTTECESLIVTLVVTLRKFTSLIFSIIYFQNPFTIYHWIGTALVFGGTLIFTETFTKIRDAFIPPKRKKAD